MGVNKSIGNPTQNHAKPYDYNKNHECGDIPIDNPIRKHPKPMSMSTDNVIRNHEEPMAIART